MEDHTVGIYVMSENCFSDFVDIKLAAAGSGLDTEWTGDGTLTGRALAAILGRVVRDPDVEARVEPPDVPFPDGTRSSQRT